ncbi:MAG TPA: hypothetical protein DD706_23425 [Nitrospiraceae bacterium]|nr:hypothetical protein [Nitrospiraceae bacterium]
MFRRHFIKITLLSLLTALSDGGWGLSHVLAQETEEVDPPEVVIGERLFLETRFAQLFQVFLDDGGDVNNPLPQGDPVLNTVTNWQLPSDQFVGGPFAGQSMNCRSCHFVDEQLEIPQYGMNTYSDFARRSPIPAREDGKHTSARNAPPLVNAALPRHPFFLHADAEFPTMVDLVKGTLTGRNYGWLPDELEAAVSHIARIIREDSGEGDLAEEFGGLSYPVLFSGTDPTIPQEFLIPENFRTDVSQATDLQLVQAVAQLIGAYTDQLLFSQDDQGNFNLSPYDVFLKINDLPRQPDKWESPHSYTRRLLQQIQFLESNDQLHYSRWPFTPSQDVPAIQFVERNPHTEDGNFQFHDQSFTFGPQELKGLKIFFTQPARHMPRHRGHHVRPSQLAQGGIGNCIACHTPPNFTDFRFHNTGIAQTEYERIHGPESFSMLEIPVLRKRNRHVETYLPATPKHPHAQEPFRAIPSVDNPGWTDLGIWNIFWNPDFPESQLSIWYILCEDTLNEHFGVFRGFQACGPDRLLPRTVGAFKTPGLRDLGHSAPYTHAGIADTLEDVVQGYIKNSELARSGRLRNGDSRLKDIVLLPEDIPALTAFLRSLNEDYE